jgi:hypothetical protein
MPPLDMVSPVAVPPATTAWAPPMLPSPSFPPLEFCFGTSPIRRAAR